VRIGIDARKIGDFGIGTYIRGLLGALVELDTGDEYIAFAPRGVQLPNGVEHVIVDAPHYSMRELIVVGRAADRAGLDLFHAPHYVVPFTRVPLAVTVHDLIHLHQPMRNPLAPLYARTMIGRAVRKAARVLTVSETVKEQLVRELACDPDRIAVTPNGVDDVFFQRPGEGKHFLYAGNDKPHKNVDVLADAFAGVRRERGDARLVLAGAPFERFRGIEGIDVRGFVPVETLARLYREAIALVLPSSEEGFGLPAAEAMASGIAVITSNAPALVEITRDAALHVDARDANELAAAMLRVMNDGALRAALAQVGVQIASSFTWKRCAEETRKAFQNVEHRGTHDH
jgi:glycosyltransferase involved in cell wall biosynthesis